MEREANLGKNIVDPGEVGGRRAGIGVVLPDHSACNTYFRIEDMGGNPLYQEGPGGVPPLGCKVDNREAPMVMIRWDMEVPPVR